MKTENMNETLQLPKYICFHVDELEINDPVEDLVTIAIECEKKYPLYEFVQFFQRHAIESPSILMRLNINWL